jgi:hypothetical protein
VPPPQSTSVRELQVMLQDPAVPQSTEHLSTQVTAQLCDEPQLTELPPPPTDTWQLPEEAQSIEPLLSVVTEHVCALPQDKVVLLSPLTTTFTADCPLMTQLFLHTMLQVFALPQSRRQLFPLPAVSPQPNVQSLFGAQVHASPVVHTVFCIRAPEPARRTVT